MNWSNDEQKPSLFKTLIDSSVKYETAERILADHADLISYIDVVTSKRYLDHLDLETSSSDNKSPDQGFRYYVYNYRSDDARSPKGLNKGLIHYKPAGYGDLRLYPLKTSASLYWVREISPERKPSCDNRL